MSEPRLGGAHSLGMNVRSFVVAMVVMGLSFAGCFKPVPTADAPCPCAEGYRCCEAANVCRASEEACPLRPGDTTSIELRPLPATADGPGPAMAFGAELRHLASTPAAFATAGHSIYVAAQLTEGCPGDPSNLRRLTVSRFDVDGGSLHWAWSTPLGGVGEASASSAVATRDSVTVGGSVSGAFPGEAAHGQGDAFVARLRTDGSVSWVRQFGTIDFEGVHALATAADGGLFAAGVTQGTLEAGHVSGGGGELFVTRLEDDGRSRWVRQLGPATLVESLESWNGAPLALAWSLGGGVGGGAELSLVSLEEDGSKRFQLGPVLGSGGVARTFAAAESARLHAFAPDGLNHYSLLEQRVATDGGLEPAASLGPWPAANDELYAFTLAHRDDGVWYAAGAAPSGKVLTVTRQGLDGGREETRRWLFDGPGVGDAHASTSFVAPLGLAVMEDGTVVLLGDFVSTDCGLTNVRSLFLMGF